MHIVKSAVCETEESSSQVWVLQLQSSPSLARLQAFKKLVEEYLSPGQVVNSWIMFWGTTESLEDLSSYRTRAYVGLLATQHPARPTSKLALQDWKRNFKRSLIWRRSSRLETRLLNKCWDLLLESLNSESVLLSVQLSAGAHSKWFHHFIRLPASAWEATSPIWSRTSGSSSVLDV
jgi:hypothetical protein